MQQWYYLSNSVQIHNMQPNNNSKFDDWAFMVSVLAGPFSLLIAAAIALVAAIFVPSDSRSKDLMQFATLLFGGGAAVTGTTQPRRINSSPNVAIEANEFNSTMKTQTPITVNETDVKESSETLQPMLNKEKVGQ
jgi:hypothetical protein